MSKEKRSTADQSGSVRLFPLTARQPQPVVHVTFAVQNGLLTNICVHFHKDQCFVGNYFNHLKGIPSAGLCQCVWTWHLQTDK